MAYTTINKSTDYFNTKLYTGNNSTNVITGVGHQPDMVWIKRRNNISDHQVYDAVRGVQKGIFTSTTGAEATEGSTRGLNAFNSDGFTLGAEVSDIAGSCNANSDTYVSWNWKANGTGSSNTDGSITSTVSANTTSGFSIVSYTGNGSSTGSNVVGHGLGTTPSMIIIKGRAGTNAVNNWYCWHKGLSANHNIALNLTAEQRTTSSYSSGIINNSPTSNTFGFDSGTSLLNINESGTTYIAYCFAEKKGFSKFGSYTGNASTDGPFVYTGFKPAFFMIKRIDDAASWYIYDNKRDSYNTMTKNVFPNTSNVEDDNVNNNVDFLSNGFKLRTISGARNTAGGTYIWMALAEAPLVGSNNIPCTAR